MRGALGGGHVHPAGRRPGHSPPGSPGRPSGEAPSPPAGPPRPAAQGRQASASPGRTSARGPQPAPRGACPHITAAGAQPRGGSESRVRRSGLRGRPAGRRGVPGSRSRRPGHPDSPPWRKRLDGRLEEGQEGQAVKGARTEARGGARVPTHGLRRAPEAAGRSAGAFRSVLGRLRHSGRSCSARRAGADPPGPTTRAPGAALHG